MSRDALFMSLAEIFVGLAAFGEDLRARIFFFLDIEVI
jgi:hypothetical protein